MRFDAVLFDRDATLVVDVPYNGDPAAVVPMPTAAAALGRLRAAGLRTGVVSNQSGVARGLLTDAGVDAVNARVEELLGPFDTWQVCRHGPADGCGCRKPAPGLVLAAAAALRVPPQRCVVVGDIGADVAAAQAAGATGILVPTPVTLPTEIAAAPVVLADLAAAADWILGGRHAPMRATSYPAAHPANSVAGARVPPAPAGRRVLVVRADAAGDVLLTGPAIRAVAARAGTVTLLCGPRGRAAAALLPGVDEIVEWALPWIEPLPGPTGGDLAALGRRLAVGGYDEAIVFTSFHQSPLPMAMLLRGAGVERISAISDDYPGTLLDLRHRVPDGVPEAERAMSLATAAGYPPVDDGRLAVAGPLPDVTALTGHRRYVVLHPGTSVPARACPPPVCARIVAALAGTGWPVLVTGGSRERALTRYVAGEHGVDLGGRTDDLGQLAAVLAGAAAVVVGNTGPAHLAAAVGTPVVSLFAPTVRYSQWRPYGVPAARLGDEGAPCRDSRATLCPVPGHPCLSGVDPAAVAAAVSGLVGSAVEDLACAS